MEESPPRIRSPCIERQGFLIFLVDRHGPPKVSQDKTDKGGPLPGPTDHESFDACKPCLMGKMTKTPFSRTMERSTGLLEIIHTDVRGPMSVEARGRYHYFLTFTDDLSIYGYIYLMKHKSETFEKFKESQSEVENHRNKKIKFLRSDHGGEYLSYELIWSSFETMWNSFATHATWNTTA